MVGAGVVVGIGVVVVDAVVVGVYMTHPSEPKDWEWIEAIEKEAKATMQSMYEMHAKGSEFWGKTQQPRALNELNLIAAIREMKFVIEEIHDQSIAHADDSLSSKWLEHLTSETLARLANL